MNTRKIIVAASSLLLVTSLWGQEPNPTPAASQEVTDSINAGAALLRAGRFAEAVPNFQKAIRFDPANERAHLDLGVTYAAQVVPNLDTPENMRMAALAIAEFDIVLKAHPENLIALSQAAYVYRNIKQLDKSKALEQRTLAIDPSDSAANYAIGVIDWMQAHTNAIKILSAENLTDDAQGNIKLSHDSCEAMRTANADLIDDAIAHLNRAIELNPNYADAMVYLNLIYRRRADLQCGEPAFIANDLRLAKEWSDQAAKIRQQPKPAATPGTGEK
jgi:tetratricopeptide (TPR) repeat protein